MKSVILLTGLMVALSGLASAQTTGSNSSNSPKISTETTDTKKTKKKGTKKSGDHLNQRKTYKWKNGQRATPTGQEATGTGSGYTSLSKDSATTKDTVRKNDE